MKRGMATLASMVHPYCGVLNDEKAQADPIPDRFSVTTFEIMKTRVD